MRGGCLAKTGLPGRGKHVSFRVSMRFLASILFALMTLILPTAGVMRNFCTMTMSYVADGGKCLAGQGDVCCCNGDSEKSPHPDCMVATKPLPNADKSPSLDLPAADGAWVLLPTREVMPPMVVCADSVRTAPHRGLPLLPHRLFLTQRRLLI